MSRAEVCHCGHDKATHFKSKHACTGIGCDPECRFFIDRDEPDFPERTGTTERPPASATSIHKPHLDSDCQCAACLTWAVQRRHWSFGFP